MFFPILFRRFYCVHFIRKSTIEKIPIYGSSITKLYADGIFFFPVVGNFLDFIFRLSVDSTCECISLGRVQFLVLTYFRLGWKIPINRVFLCFFIFIVQQHISWISSCFGHAARSFTFILKQFVHPHLHKYLMGNSQTKNKTKGTHMFAW